MKRLHTRLIAVLLSVLVVGCGPNRVVLRTVPEKTAPLHERQRALKDLAPESGLQTTYYRDGVPVGTNLDWLMLGDGTRVEDPRDLLPAVDDSSPTANYARSYAAKRTATQVWALTGLGAFAAGLVVEVLSLVAMLNALTSQSGGSVGPSQLLTGMAVGAGLELGAIISFGVAIANGAAANKDRLSAFQTYPKALQRRLALQEDAPAEESHDKQMQNEVSVPTDVPFRMALLPVR